MRKPGGYAMLFDETGIKKEADTISCGHCNRIVHVKPYERPEDIGGLCKRCVTYICPECTKIGDCDPIEKKLERWEANDAFWRDFKEATVGNGR